LIVHDNEPLPPPEVLLSTLRACSATQVARVVPASAQCVSVLLTAPHNVLSTPALHPYNLRIALRRSAANPPAWKDWCALRNMLYRP
jgi:hypothetical protein